MTSLHTIIDTGTMNLWSYVSLVMECYFFLNVISSPDKSIKYILDDQIALSDYNQESYVSPSKQRELLHVILFDEGQHKPDESSNVEAEREESVVCDQNFEEVLQNEAPVYD